jgi:hypothetical protein
MSAARAAMSPAGLGHPPDQAAHSSLALDGFLPTACHSTDDGDDFGVEAWAGSEHGPSRRCPRGWGRPRFTVPECAGQQDTDSDVKTDSRPRARNWTPRSRGGSRTVYTRGVLRQEPGHSGERQPGPARPDGEETVGNAEELIRNAIRLTATSLALSSGIRRPGPWRGPAGRPRRYGAVRTRPWTRPRGGPVLQQVLYWDVPNGIEEVLLGLAGPQGCVTSQVTARIRAVRSVRLTRRSSVVITALDADTA